MNGVEAGIIYAFKSMAKASPFTFMGVIIALMVIIPGYCIRIFERPLMIVSG